jgi:hypothetical protein
MTQEVIDHQCSEFELPPAAFQVRALTPAELVVLADEYQREQIATAQSERHEQECSK